MEMLTTLSDSIVSAYNPHLLLSALHFGRHNAYIPMQCECWGDGCHVMLVGEQWQRESVDVQERWFSFMMVESMSKDPTGMRASCICPVC